MQLLMNWQIHEPSHSTKAPYRNGVKDVIGLVQSRKIFFIFSSVTAGLQTIMWSFYLPTSDWLCLFGSISFSDKTLKVQFLVLTHIIPKENGLTIILNDKQFIRRSSVHFKTVFFLCTLFLISGSRGEVDPSHHLLDLLFILQYVGLYCTNLVLLILDQLFQLN